MKKLIIIFFALASVIACKNNSESETGQKSILEIGCYAYKNDGDEIKMEITEINDKITGNLDVFYAEKDANEGKFVGTLHGDKLIGVYTFNSEGITSSREMAFLVQDNQLIEGFGDLNEEGTKFKDVNSIKYTSTMPLTKVDCNN